MKNILKSLVKSVSISLGLTPMASATDAAIQKKNDESGMTTLIVSNEQTDDIKKIDTSIKDSGLLMKGVSKTTKNKTKEQKGGFLSMLLSILDASLLGNLWTGEGYIRAGEGVIVMSPGQSTIRPGQNF